MENEHIWTINVCYENSWVKYPFIDMGNNLICIEM